MAKPKKVTMPEPVEFVPPPVTKQDAGEPHWNINYTDRSFNTGHPHERIYPDGYDAGNELPDDVYIDRLVFPATESKADADARAETADRENQAMAFRTKAFERSRNFDIRLGSATGKDPGPPGLYDED